MKHLGEVERTDAAVTEFADVSDELQRRGLGLLRHHSQFHEHTVDDWIAAGRALARQPVFEVRRAGDVVEVVAALVDVDPKLLVIEATSETLVITSTAPHRRVFLSMHLPKRIVPATVHAECPDGLLLVTAMVEARVEGSGESPVRVRVGR
jgi:HSP20 family molecular chaperone IbpA